MVTNMEEKVIEQLNRIERYSMIAAKSVLTMEECALFTGLSKSRLYKLTCTQQIPHYKPNGKLVYFDKKEIEKWLTRNRVATIQDIEAQANEYLTKAAKPASRIPKRGGLR